MNIQLLDRFNLLWSGNRSQVGINPDRVLDLRVKILLAAIIIFEILVKFSLCGFSNSILYKLSALFIHCWAVDVY